MGVVFRYLNMIDAEDRYVVWNRQYAEMYAELRHTIVAGGRFEDTLRAGLAVGQYPDAQGREQEWLLERLAQQAMPQSTLEQRLANGRWIRIEERRTADGGSIGIHIDITERKRREASFRLLLESNPVPMWIIDRETLRFLAVNNAAAEHYGYSSERFLELSLLDIVAPEHREDVRHAALPGASDLTGQTRRHIKANGSAIDVAVYTRSLHFNGRAASLVAVFDLTKRNRAEMELQNTREFLNMIVENVPVGIVVKEPTEQRCVLVNRAAEEFWGISRDNMLGKRAKDIFPEATVNVMPRDGHSAVRFFDAEMDHQLHEKRVLQQELQSAIERNEFALDYQPLARIDGEIFGFEALARWNHPTRGLLPPSIFIPISEECGLIAALSGWIVRQACREAASWPKPLQIAVNISPNQFRHGDLGGLIHSTLLESGLTPGRLELEITEGVLIDDFSRAVSILRRIKSLGVQIALDDFGTGYSSLSYLQSFPFDKMKIDKSFVSDLKNPQSAVIIRAVIGLGRALRVPVLAEGVETREQLAYLAQEGCDEVQGFLVGRPLPIADYGEVIGRTGAADRKMRLVG